MPTQHRVTSRALPARVSTTTSLRCPAALVACGTASTISKERSMHVEVNEANIDRYKLVELTGNSREMMLSRAAEAKESGHILSVEVPDDQVLEQNVFDVYKEEHVDPRRLEEGCHYELALDGGDMICVVHGQPSK